MYDTTILISRRSSCLALEDASIWNDFGPSLSPLIGWFHLVMQVASCRVDMSSTGSIALTVERNTMAELSFLMQYTVEWEDAAAYGFESDTEKKVERNRLRMNFTFWRCDKKMKRESMWENFTFFLQEVTPKKWRERLWERKSLFI